MDPPPPSAMNTSRDRSNVGRNVTTTTTPVPPILPVFASHQSQSLYSPSLLSEPMEWAPAMPNAQTSSAFEPATPRRAGSKKNRGRGRGTKHRRSTGSLLVVDGKVVHHPSTSVSQSNQFTEEPLEVNGFVQSASATHQPYASVGLSSLLPLLSPSSRSRSLPTAAASAPTTYPPIPLNATSSGPTNTTAPFQHLQPRVQRSSGGPGNTSSPIIMAETISSSLQQLAQELHHFQALIADLQGVMLLNGKDMSAHEAEWRTRILIRSAQEADNDLWRKLYKMEQQMLSMCNEANMYQGDNTSEIILQKRRVVREAQARCHELQRQFKHLHKTLLRTLEAQEQAQRAAVAQQLHTAAILMMNPATSSSTSSSSSVVDGPSPAYGFGPVAGGYYNGTVSPSTTFMMPRPTPSPFSSMFEVKNGKAASKGHDFSSSQYMTPPPPPPPPPPPTPPMATAHAPQVDSPAVAPPALGSLSQMKSESPPPPPPPQARITPAQARGFAAESSAAASSGTFSWLKSVPPPPPPPPPPTPMAPVTLAQGLASKIDSPAAAHPVLGSLSSLASTPPPLTPPPPPPPPPPPVPRLSRSVAHADRTTRQDKLNLTNHPAVTFRRQVKMMEQGGPPAFNASVYEPTDVDGYTRQGRTQPSSPPTVDRPPVWASQHCTAEGPVGGFGRYVNRAAPGLCGSLESLGDPRYWSFGGIEALDLVYKGSDVEFSNGAPANPPAQSPAPVPAVVKDDDDSDAMTLQESEVNEMERVQTEGASIDDVSSLGIGSSVPRLAKTFPDASISTTLPSVKQVRPASCGAGTSKFDSGMGKRSNLGPNVDADGDRYDRAMSCGALQGMALDEIQRNLVQFGRNVVRRTGTTSTDEEEVGCDASTSDRSDKASEDCEGDEI